MAERKGGSTVTAAKVHEAEYVLTECPVCGVEIVGKLTVEVHLGDVMVTKSGGDDQKPLPHATANVTTRMRSLDVSHKCEVRKTEAPVDTEVNVGEEQGDDGDA